MTSQMSRESVACDLCGTDDAALLLVKHSWRLVRCRRCELVYVNPRPPRAALAAIYDVDVFHDGQIERAEDEAWIEAARQRLALIDRHRPARGALLDVGCSTGWFLSIARGGGWRVSGLDISAATVAYSRRRGFDARVASLESHDLPAKSFDAVTMFDSLEHMPSPMAALRAARELLADGGVVMITTPNIDGAFPRLTYQLFGRTLGAWEHPGPPGHVYQFSRRTLRAVLERAGFTIVHDETEAIDPAHTIGALTNAVLDAMKQTTRRTPAADPDAVTDAHHASAPAPAQPRRLRRAARAVVHAGASLLVRGLALPAARLDRGDSLVVVARRSG